MLSYIKGKSLFIAAIVLLMIPKGILYGQSGMSIYHLKGRTIQGSNFNAAFMPRESFVLGLPALSGIGVSLNSPFSYNDVVITDDNGDLQFQDEALIDLIDDKSFLSTNVDLTLLYLGMRPSPYLGFSFFVRQRASISTFVDSDPLKLITERNPQFEGRQFNIDRTLVDARYYREYGVGMVVTVPDYGFEFGGRLKLLNGIANITSERGLSASVDIGNFPDASDLQEIALNFANGVSDGSLAPYDQSAQVQNAVLHTSGFNAVEEIKSHTLPSGNLGLGVDLGINWQINDYFSTSLAINDLGFIRWKKDVKNYQASNVNVQVDNITDLVPGLEEGVTPTAQTITDLLNTDYGSLYESVVDSLEAVFEADTTETAYTTGLNTNLFASATYHLTPKDEATATVAGFFVQDRMRLMYALGYTRKFGNVLALSGNLVGAPQSGIDVGIGMAIDFAAFQFYAATDRLTEVFQYKDAKAFDVRLGLVVVLGRGKPKSGKGPKPDRYDYNDGAIYYKIRKRKQPEPYQYPKNRRSG